MPNQRNIITDFSAGQIDAAAAGRVDLPFANHGAKEMLNVVPGLFGMAQKRGGLEHLATLLGAARVIGWGINNDVDLLIVVYDREIRLMAMREDGSVVALKDPLGADIAITRLDGPTGSVLTYATADAKRIKYAQALNEITFVCGGIYPPFYMKLDNLASDYSSAAISYGIYSFTGNVASNPAINLEDATKPITGDNVVDALRAVAIDTDHATDATSFIYINNVKKTVTKVRRTGQIYPRYCVLYTTEDGFPYNGQALYDTTSGTVGADLAFGDHHRNIFYVEKYTVEAKTTCVGGTTIPTLLDRLEANFGSGQKFYIGDQDGGAVVQQGSGYFYARRDTSKVTITYVEGAGTATKEVLPDSTEYKLSISIEASGVSINGGITSAAEIVNNTVPWMEKNKDYPCSGDMLLNGQVVASARRIDADDSPCLEVILSGEPASPRVITRDSEGLIGRVGVIVTPFYGAVSGEWPCAVAYHQGRLVLAARNVVYMSKVNDFSNFSYFEEIEFTTTSLKPAEEWNDAQVPETRTDTSFSQEVGASSAIKLILATDENEDVQSLTSMGDLIIATATTEWVFPAQATALNPQVVMTSRYGSSDMQARFIMGALILVSRTGRSVNAYYSDGRSTTISEIAATMFKSGVVGYDFRQDPTPEIHFYLADGTVVLARKQGDGIAFSAIAVKDATVESVCVVNGSDEDAVLYVAKRGSVYSLERLRTADDSIFPSTTAVGRAHLDSFSRFTISGLAILGLTRFASETVRIHLLSPTEGEVLGSITFNAAGNATQFTRDPTTEVPTPVPEALQNVPCIVGRAFDMVLETYRLDSPGTEGLTKGAGPMHLRVYESGPFSLTHGGKVFPITPPRDIVGGIQYPYSGPIRFENPAGNAVDQSVRLVSSDGVPVNIQAIVATYEVGEQG